MLKRLSIAAAFVTFAVLRGASPAWAKAGLPATPQDLERIHATWLRQLISRQVYFTPCPKQV